MNDRVLQPGRRHRASRRGRRGIVAACAVALAGCVSPAGAPASAPETTGAAMNHGLRTAVEGALEDASRVTGLDRSELVVVSAESVTWPDGSLGCPRPGRMYTQALVRGYRVRIQAGKRLLDYHAGSRGTPFPCPEEFASEPIHDDDAPAVR